MNNELRRVCNVYANELKKAYNGELVLIDDEIVDLNNLDCKVGNVPCYEISYGTWAREDELEQATVFDLLNNAWEIFDFEYTLNGNKELIGVRLMVACGGPNIYIDTRHGEIQGYWGCDRESAWLPNEICEEINLMFYDEF